MLCTNFSWLKFKVIQLMLAWKSAKWPSRSWTTLIQKWMDFIETCPENITTTIERFRCAVIILSDDFLFRLFTKSALVALIARSHWIRHHAMMHQMAKYFANHVMAKISDQKVTVMVEAMCLLWWLVNLDNLPTIVFSKQIFIYLHLYININIYIYIYLLSQVGQSHDPGECTT